MPITLGPNKMHQAITAATQDAASQLGENEQFITESVQLDGSATARWDDATEDFALMDFHYTCSVMMPTCTDWSKPVR